MRTVIRSSLAALVLCGAALTQNAGPVFEVASVKPTPPSPDGRVMFMAPRGGPGTSDPGRISWPNARIISVIAQAFDVQAYQISGPPWLETERYDFQVTLPEGATKEQSRLMWQNLLAQRFGMAVDHVSREFQIQELVQAKGGAKLRPYAENPSAPKDGPPQIDVNGRPDRPTMITMIRPGPDGAPTAHLAAQGQEISSLVRMMNEQLRQPVVDKTGLTGKYDFELDFTPNVAGLPGPLPITGAATDPGTNLGTALEQIGLRLNPTKGMLDVVVIDKISRTPTEN